MKKTTFLFFTCVLASFLAGCSSSDDEEVEVQGLHTPLKFVSCFIQEKLRKL